MYAVIATGGKQYKVTTGKIIKVEKLTADVGQTIEFSPLMLVSNEEFKIGNPCVDKAKVKATVIKHGRKDKILIVKFRRRKHHRKQMGHRQDYTAIQISEINS